MGDGRTGGDEYISQLVGKYADMVLRIALTYLKNIPDAQDACQDVYMKLLKQRKAFTDSEHEKAWIIRVTINTCKDALRRFWRRKRHTVPIDETVLPIANQAGKEIVSLVLDLPEKYRAVIYLYYFEGYNAAETAMLLSRNENTIRTQLKRARELLKVNMKGGFDLDVEPL